RSPRWRISSTPRRNSPTVTTERYAGTPSLRIRAKKSRTPRSALSVFLISLTTFVSIKYTPAALAIQTSEVLVFTDVGDRGEHLGETLSGGTKQSLLQDDAVFRFGASPVSCSSLFQRLDNPVVEVSHYQTRHSVLSPTEG